MTQAGEAGPGRREERLAGLREKMRRAARRGDAEGLEGLKREYEALKVAHVARSHEEQREEARARRAAVRAAEARQEPVRWRLPAGFGRSPFARARDRMPRPAEQLQVPAGGHLSPWRGVHPASERVWRP